MSDPGVVRAQTPRDPFSVLAVPFIAQSEDLCGGAAAAMVLRYWGVTDVQAEDFSPLVDHARGGISVRDLTSALSSRGLPSSSLAEDGSGIESSIAAGRPAIVLIDGGHGRLHYVVVVAWSRGHVLYHDPSAGPFRMTTEAAFREMRKPGNGWAIAPSPETAPSVADARSSTSDSPAPSSAVGLASPPRLPSACDVVLEPWIAVARGGAPEDAVEPCLLYTSPSPRD